MALRLEEIEKLGELARLRIEPDEIEDLVAKLTSILEFVDQLQAAETGDVEPMAHAARSEPATPTGRVTETDHHELYQQNAPQVERGLYLVPRVIE